MTYISRIALSAFFITALINGTASAQTVTAANKQLIRLCEQRPVTHIPNSDVSYKAGIDVDGNPVIPADIGTNLGTNIYPLRIPLELDLRERFNLDIPRGIIADAEVADIMVHEDGLVTYNGQDITTNIEAYCTESNIIAAPPNNNAPGTETIQQPKNTTTTSDGQVEIEPLNPPKEDEIIKGEHH